MNRLNNLKKYTYKCDEYKMMNEYDDDDDNDNDEMEQTTYLEIIGCPFVGYIINN